MTTITIAYEVSNSAFERIESLVERELTHNSVFSGAKIEIERGDFTSIDSDEYDYVSLTHKINDIITNS